MAPQGRTWAGSWWIDVCVGALGGITGGLAAFPGAFVTIWCSVRGWDKSVQRAVTQPFILAMQLITLATMQAQHRRRAYRFDSNRGHARGALRCLRRDEGVPLAEQPAVRFGAERPADGLGCVDDWARVVMARPNRSPHGPACHVDCPVAFSVGPSDQSRPSWIAIGGNPIPYRAIAARRRRAAADPRRCRGPVGAPRGCGADCAGEPRQRIRRQVGHSRRRVAGRRRRGSQSGGADFGDPARPRGSGRRRLDRNAGAPRLSLRRPGCRRCQPLGRHRSPAERLRTNLAGAADVVRRPGARTRRDHATTYRRTLTHVDRHRRHRQDPADPAGHGRHVRCLSATARGSSISRPLHRSGTGAERARARCCR